MISPLNLITVESSPLKFAHCHGMKSFAKIITRGDHWYRVWKCLGWSRGTRDILRNSGGFLIGSKMIFMDLWQGKWTTGGISEFEWILPMDHWNGFELLIFKDSVPSQSLARVVRHPKKAEWESVAHVRSKVPRALQQIFTMLPRSN